ncbi:MAG: anti-sigma factor antagonist [Clostridia bacterium]|nr:anti-sigma factor antagonist [Clostridia bacterium]
MEIKYSKKKDLLTVFLCGELDEYSAKYARESLDGLLDENLTSKKVVFDLSEVSFMDSTGIGLLIGRYKKLKNFSIPTYITGAGVATEKVIELAGLYSIMPKY